MMKGHFKIFAGILLAAFSASASAQISNASFEEPFLNSGFNSNGIQGWTNSSGSTGSWVLPAAGFFTTAAPDGRQIGYSNASSVSSETGYAIEEGTQTLTIMAGRRSDGFAGSFALELWAGGSAVTGNIVGGNLLASALFDHTAVDPTSWHLLEVSYTALSGDVAIGQSVGIRMVRTAGSQMDFDDVRYNGAVPEPSTLLAAAVGLVALRLRRRRA